MADPVSFAITVALNAAAMAATAMRKIEGPRLTDLSVTVADYGTPLNYVYGRRRVEVPCFYAEPIKEKKKKRKTKGGKYKEFTYFGTWAVALADHEISRVRRIWFDRHLVYDADATGATSIFDLADDYEFANSVAIFYGTPDQEAHERMVSYVEADEGVGTCPDYKDVAYILFIDIPLEKLGNRHPQVSIEFDGILSADGGGYLKDEAFFTDYNWSSKNSIYRDQGQNYWLGGAGPVGGNQFDTTVTIIDDSTRQEIFSAENNYTWSYMSLSSFGNKVQIGAIDSAGSIWGTDYFVGGGASKGLIIEIQNFGAGPVVVHDRIIVSSGSLQSLYCADLPSFSRVTLGRYDNKIFAFYGGTVYTYSPPGGRRYLPTFYCQDEYGDIWAGAVSLSAPYTTVIFNRLIANGLSPIISSSISVSGFDNSSGAANRMFYANGEFIVFGQGLGKIYRVDIATASIIQTTTIESSSWLYPYKKPNSDKFALAPVAPVAFGDFTIYNTADFSVVGSFNSTDWGTGTYPADTLAQNLEIVDYDATTDEWIGFAFTSSSPPSLYNAFGWYSFIGGAADFVLLSNIISDVCIRSGMAAADFDCSACDARVPGYSWTQGSGKDILGPLLDVYDIDARPHDFQIEFLPRGSAIAGAIETAEFATSGDNRYKLSITAESDLPRRLFFSFADIDGEQQTNTAVVQRPADTVDSAREISIDMTTLALSASEAADYAARMHRLIWFSRESAEFSVTAKQLLLEPGDTFTLTFDDAVVTMKAAKVTIGADGVIGTRWDRYHPSLALLPGMTGAVASGRPAPTIYDPAPSAGFFLDIPLISDVHDASAPFIYLAAGPVNDTELWPGADVWQSDSGLSDDYAAGWDGFGSSDMATHGAALTVMPPASPNLIDRGTSIDIQLVAGELSSITEAAMLADSTANLAIIGNEIIQFATATLIGPKLYRLSNLVRGARGTEWAIETHDYIEDFLLLDANVKRHALGASKIGDTDYYIAESLGINADPNQAVAVDFSAAAHKPYSPAHLESALDDYSGEWTLSWIRRTRIGGATLNGQDVPLGETSEAYRVVILNGGAIVRTIDTTSNSLVYSLADQITDFGMPVSGFEWRVCQRSPNLGIDGFYATATAA